MPDIVYGEGGLPCDFPGGYVAWLDDQIVMTGSSEDELYSRLDEAGLDEARVVIGYVEPYDVVRVY
jgi:hypothetical protein